MKALGKELDRMSKIKGTTTAIDDILDSIKKMSPAEIKSHADL